MVSRNVELIQHLKEKFGSDTVVLDLPTGQYFVSEDVDRIAKLLIGLPYYQKRLAEGVDERDVLDEASEEACELLESFGLIHTGG